MIWVILAVLGVPLWLCGVGFLILVFNNRKLRKRPGDIPVRILRPGKKRWVRGHAIWVSDVFAWRASPAGWSEDILEVSEVSPRAATAQRSTRSSTISRTIPWSCLWRSPRERPLELPPGPSMPPLFSGPLASATEHASKRLWPPPRARRASSFR